ncbi:MAG: TonB-dependent receptor, partial [Caulobacteraceae bacterium]
MTKASIRERLMASTIAGGAALLALTAIPAAAVLAMPTVASAQDYTSGTLGGRVQSNAGEAVAGATVVVRSADQGITRTTTTDASGAFRLPLIPVGQYEVTIDASGFDSLSDRVSVALGGQSNYDFTIQSTGDVAELGEVVVTGARRRLDFTQTTTGATLDVEELIDQVPVGRTITAITLLAPGAVAGDSQFAVSTSQLQTPPSISGASVAENAYFVNGLNTTNFVNGLGGAGVPFEFYKTVEVKTGGYNAEYGRATGGVINAITKSGTNDFVVELHGTWAPDSLRSDTPDTVTLANSLGEYEQKTFTFEMGGPIIRDRLFAYGLASWSDTESAVASSGGVLSRDSFSSDPFYGVKLDGYITSDHRLEFTYFDTQQTRTRTNYSFDPDTFEVDPTVNSIQTLEQGGKNYV